MPVARDVMISDVTTVPATATVSDVLETIRGKSYTGLPVTDEAGQLVGFVTQNDILRGLAFTLDSESSAEGFHEGKRRAGVKLLAQEVDATVPVKQYLARPVTDLMTASPFSCGPDEALAAICDEMVARRFHRVVVVESGRVVGLISSTDLVSELGRRLR